MLNRVSEVTLPSHESDKSLADQFAFFLINLRILKVLLSSPFNPSKIAAVARISEDAVNKIIRNSPTKSCPLDPWPTFLIKEYGDMLLPSTTKFVNC